MNLHHVLMASIPPLLSLSLLELPCLNSVHTCLSWSVLWETSAAPREEAGLPAKSKWKLRVTESSWGREGDSSSELFKISVAVYTWYLSLVVFLLLVFSGVRFCPHVLPSIPC